MSFSWTKHHSKSASQEYKWYRRLVGVNLIECWGSYKQWTSISSRENSNTSSRFVTSETGVSGKQLRASLALNWLYTPLTHPFLKRLNHFISQWSTPGMLKILRGYNRNTCFVKYLINRSISSINRLAKTPTVLSWNACVVT